MKTKHTLGPWDIDTNDNYVSQYRIYETRTGLNVGWFDPDSETTEQGEANAKLIAACPDLLEALIGVTKALDRMIYKYDRDSIEAEWIGEANEAILKATGQNLKATGN